MKAIVNKDACIGCGACTYTCPDVFELSDDGVATVKVEEVADNNKDAVVEASENCPTSAISTE